MDHYVAGDVVVTSSKVFKIKKFTQVTEFLLVNSLKHPHIIGCESIKFRSGDPDGTDCIMEMKRGDRVGLGFGGTGVGTGVENFLNILETLIYLERHGIIYGDLKTNNMVMVDDQIKLIDFGLMNFAELRYQNLSQTYSDRLQYTWDIENEKYSHRKNLIWAIGILALEFFGDIVFYEISDYNNFVFLSDGLLNLDKERLGKWFPFIEKCLSKYIDRIDSVEELWKYLPSEYYREMNIYSEEPDFSSSKSGGGWYPQLDIVPFWMYTYLSVHARRDETTIRAISLFKEYYHEFIEVESVDILSNGILAFGCACILLTGDLFNEDIDVISLSDSLDGEVSDAEIISTTIKFIEKLNFRLPYSLISKRQVFRDSIGLDALLQGITNVNNYSEVRDGLSDPIEINEEGVYIINPEASQYISDFFKEWSQKVGPGFISFESFRTESGPESEGGL